MVCSVEAGTALSKYRNSLVLSSSIPNIFYILVRSLYYLVCILILTITLYLSLTNTSVILNYYSIISLHSKKCIALLMLAYGRRNEVPGRVRPKSDLYYVLSDPSQFFFLGYKALPERNPYVQDPTQVYVRDS